MLQINAIFMPLIVPQPAWMLDSWGFSGTTIYAPIRLKGYLSLNHAVEPYPNALMNPSSS